MENTKYLSEELMWEITKKCDPQYDGKFYYAVKTTMIFCRPSCKSKTPLLQNVSFFSSVREAVSKGYRTCKRCRPELSGHYNPSESVLKATELILMTEYEHSDILKDLSSRVGMSSFHLHRLFKESTGRTPKEFLEEIRVNKAKELLVTSSLSNTEICYAVGFQSLPRFYHIFREKTGFSPKKFKEMSGEGNGK
jgi:AraC family transcriptional regulator of adaptative response / methylphosphotriester-DNA alkyltransferase methyltransferase